MPGPRATTSALPAEFADYTLLPEVRPSALTLFAELGIAWHASVHGGPSNHRLSSQVQCVNALAQMMRDPSRLVRAFGDLLGTAEVLEIEPGRYLTFEYIGPEDFFNEASNGVRVRGAHCTSVGPDPETMGTAGACDASLPGGALRRHTPKVGARAVIPHAGICAGGRSQGRSLPRLRGTSARKLLIEVLARPSCLRVERTWLKRSRRKVTATLGSTAGRLAVCPPAA